MSLSLLKRPDITHRLPPNVTIVDSVLHQGVIALQALYEHRPTTQDPCACEDGAPTWQSSGYGSHTYRAPPVGGRPVIMVVEYKAWRCKHCGVSCPHGLPRGSVTEEFGRMIGEYTLRHPATEAARHFHVERQLASEWGDVVMDERLAALEVLPPEYLGLDDTKLAGARRLMVVDIPRARHIEILEGYGRAAATTYLRDRAPEWTGVTRAVVIDQWESFRQAVLSAWPDLPIVLDKFHIARPINAACRVACDEAPDRPRGQPSIVTLHRKADGEDFGAYLEDVRERDPDVVTAFEYSQGWKALYRTASAPEARAAWMEWAADMPDFLRPHLKKTVERLTRSWLTEITAAVEVRKSGGTDPTNAVTETLNNRAKRLSRMSGLDFARQRGRLLLAESARDQDRASAEVRQVLREALKCLKGD